MLELKRVGMSFDVKGKLFKSEKKAVVIRDFNLNKKIVIIRVLF